MPQWVRLNEWLCRTARSLLSIWLQIVSRWRKPRFMPIDRVVLQLRQTALPLHQHCRDNATFFVFACISAQILLLDFRIMRFEEHGRALPAPTAAYHA